MSGSEQFKAIVRGRVQGVYFRASTRDVAREKGLGGYARNRPDGAVEVVATGPRVRLDELIAYLGRGPDGARVESLDVSWNDASEAPFPFAILW
jgi:acylphosphatase